MHILQQDSSCLTQLINKVEHIKELQNIFNHEVGEPIAKSCEVANYENGTLTILTTNAVCATQLRYQMGDLLNALRKHSFFYNLKNINCIIRPHQETLLPQPTKTLTLSSESALAITNAAKHIKHKKLKRVLLKIAKRS